MPAEDGIERSAILLIALGEDFASEVLKHLGPKEVQKLGHAMASLKSVPRTQAVSYTHLRAHETVLDLVCRLLLEKKTNKKTKKKKKCVTYR